MGTICGVDCSGCLMKAQCKGCSETDGHPSGGRCVAGECYKKGGAKVFGEYKDQVIAEFNALGIQDMPPVTELYQLCGAHVNLEYPLPNGEKVKLLDDRNIYLGYQLEKINSDRCYGIVADDEYLLVCEYGCNSADAEIIVYRKRNI